MGNGTHTFNCVRNWVGMLTELGPSLGNSNDRPDLDFLSLFQFNTCASEAGALFLLQSVAPYLRFSHKEIGVVNT